MTRRFIPLAAAGLLLLGACAEDGSHDRTRGDAEQMLGQVPDERLADDADVDQPVSVILTEWSVQLDRDTIQAGSVRFRIRNNGEHDHALAVEGMGRHERSTEVRSGQWAVLDMDLEPGTYQVYCPLDAPVGSDHADRGMRGVLTVTAGPTPGPE